jgi:hypothetical protein
VCVCVCVCVRVCVLTYDHTSNLAKSTTLRSSVT